MGPVRQNPIQRTVRSVHSVRESHCAQLLHTILPVKTVAQKYSSNDIDVIFLYWRKYIYSDHAEKPTELEMYANAQRDGRPAEHR